ncbi:MAG: malate dehydrogenase [Candidatus Omnitrophica bacterium]|nr:malate dehydrogenase [Candidatus Omnitrophota bacterium]
MKISILGAGNVGGTTALRLAHENVGELVLFDIVSGLAKGKVMDMLDARLLVKTNYALIGTEDVKEIKDSDIVVITAGLARKPGMTREELLAKNAQILKGLCLNIRELAPDSVVVVVTNPLDAMTYLVHKSTKFDSNKVIGMGASLDAARLANLISEDLNIPVTDVEPCVIGVHGEGMLPMPRFTTVKGVTLEEFFSEEQLKALLSKTINRGAQIVSHLGSGSAFYAPSAAIASLVLAIAKDEKRTIAVSALLQGEYGAKDVCVGVPCRIGRSGIENIIELDLNEKEKAAFSAAVSYVHSNIKLLADFIS